MVSILPSEDCVFRLDSRYGFRHAANLPVTFTDVTLDDQGFGFNGSSSYIDAGNDGRLDITNEITIEAVVKINDVVSLNAIVSKGLTTEQQYVFRVNDNKQLFLYSNPAGTWKGLEDSRVLSNNTWYHLVVVDYADGTMDFYQNGVGNAGSSSIGLGDPTGYPKLSYNHPVLIGNKNGYTQFIEGYIKHVSIYNRALTAQEVLDRYNKYTFGGHL